MLWCDLYYSIMKNWGDTAKICTPSKRWFAPYWWRLVHMENCRTTVVFWLRICTISINVLEVVGLVSVSATGSAPAQHLWSAASLVQNTSAVWIPTEVGAFQHWQVEYLALASLTPSMLIIFFPALTASSSVQGNECQCCLSATPLKNIHLYHPGCKLSSSARNTIDDAYCVEY